MKTQLLWPQIRGEGAPAIEHHPAPNSNGVGVLVCPGGGYWSRAIGHEGADIAAWLNARGFDAWILTYRVAEHFPVPLHPGPLHDAKKAMETIRGLKKVGKLGVWGFSAGGHLAATLATQFDPQNRPDFAILAYPVISMRSKFIHEGSRDNLLGPHPAPGLANFYSAERNVSHKTPPTFLFHTSDDPAVPVKNSLAFYEALSKNGVPAELHIYETGRHGVGLASDNAVLASWSARLDDWLQKRLETTP